MEAWVTSKQLYHSAWMMTSYSSIDGILLFSNLPQLYDPTVPKTTRSCAVMVELHAAGQEMKMEWLVSHMKIPVTLQSSFFYDTQLSVHRHDLWDHSKVVSDEDNGCSAQRLAAHDPRKRDGPIFEDSWHEDRVRTQLCLSVIHWRTHWWLQLGDQTFQTCRRHGELFCFWDRVNINYPINHLHSSGWPLNCNDPHASASWVGG